MISTTGRIPVIAAPTPTPVNPASEIGVSITRSVPNSSTRPDSTLKGVPASATSSPKMHTRESRRISSASASRIACANVNSRAIVSGIHVLVYFLDTRIPRRNRKLHRRLHFCADFVLHSLQRAAVGKLLSKEPRLEILDWIALGLPFLLFFFRPVIFPRDISHVVPGVAIRIANQKRRTFAFACLVDKFLRRRVNRSHILPIHALRRHTERHPPRQYLARRRFRIVRVLRVQIVLTNVNDRQLPQCREVHHFVQNSLPQRAFSEKAHRYLSSLQLLRRKCGPSGNSRATSYDRVRPQVSGSRIGYVHRPAFAPAIARLFP